MNSLVFVDGPYGLKKYSGDTIRNRQSDILYREIIMRSSKICDGHLVICGTFDSLSWINEIVFNHCEHEWIYRSAIVWHKPDWVGGAVKNIKTFSPRYEMMLHFSKCNAKFYADAVRVPYGYRASMGVNKKTGSNHGWKPNPKGARCGDVWTVTSQRLKEKKGGRTQSNKHSCQKPDELLERIILSMTAEGDTVIEPFVGSDNLKRVCEKLGRKYEGFDKAEDFIYGGINNE